VKELTLLISNSAADVSTAAADDATTKANSAQNAAVSSANQYTDDAVNGASAVLANADANNLSTAKKYTDGAKNFIETTIAGKRMHFSSFESTRLECRTLRVFLRVLEYVHVFFQSSCCC
jgi:hypothetical protein